MRLSDVRRLFRLIGEIREVGADPQTWRPHLLRGLSKIIPCDLIVSSEVHFRTTNLSSKFKVIDVGWVLDSGGELIQIRTEREEQPETYWVVIGQREPKHSPSADEVVAVRPTTPLRGGKAFILSQVPLAHLGAVDQLGLHRYDHDKPFSPLEHRLVRLFHVELGRLWRADALKKIADPAAALPPRLTETLEGLLKGESEKQIAFALGLSTHTIHNYIRALHRRYDVSSRAELLAKAGKERYDFRPKLSVSVSRRGGRAARKAGDAVPRRPKS